MNHDQIRDIIAQILSEQGAPLYVGNIHSIATKRGYSLPDAHQLAGLMWEEPERFKLTRQGWLLNPEYAQSSPSSPGQRVSTAQPGDEPPASPSPVMEYEEEQLVSLRRPDKYLDTRPLGPEDLPQEPQPDGLPVEEERQALPRHQGRPLRVLNLSLRPHNALMRAGIQSVEELEAISEEALITIRGLGLAAIVEIRAALASYDPSAPYEVERSESEEGAAPAFHARGDEIPLPRTLSIEEYPARNFDIDLLDLSLRTRNALVRAGAYTINDLWSASQEGLARIPNVGPLAIREIGEALLAFWQGLSQEERCDAPPSPPSGPTADPEPPRKEPALHADLDSITPEGVEVAAHLLVSEDTSQRLADLGVPTYELPWPDVLPRPIHEAVARHGQTLRHLFALYAALPEAHSLRLPRVLNETRAAIEHYLSSILQVAGRLQMSDTRQGPPSTRTLRLGDLLALVLLPARERDLEVLLLRRGLLGGESPTLEQVAQQMGLTRERVRQLEGRAYRHLRNNRYCAIERSKSILLSMLESFVRARRGAARLEEIAADLEQAGRAGITSTLATLGFLLEQLEPLTDLGAGVYALPDLETSDISMAPLQQAIISELKEEGTQHSLSDLVLEVAAALPPNPAIERRRLVELAASSHPDITIDNEGWVGLRSWQRRWTDELLRAVRDIGKPAHFSAIAERTNALLPPDRQVDAHNVHAMMQRRTDLFVRVGSGIYGLVEWGLEADRTTTDAAYRILSERGAPIPMQELVDLVLQQRHVKPTSVYAMVPQDSRFCWFEDDIGLCEWHGQFRQPIHAHEAGTPPHKEVSRMIRAQDQQIQSLVADMDAGKLLMPEFQRRYVWKPEQVRNLFDSLYRKYPSGQLLVWETDDIPITRAASIEGTGFGERRPQLLLDGQQRLTSLSSIMLGKPLVVKGSAKPIDIVFNVFTEKFEVASPRQRGQAGWISLTKFFTQGAMSVFASLTLDEATAEEKQLVFDRLTRLENIKTYSYRVNVLEQLSYDEVTDIFVRVNSAGTPLNKGDLALAQVSSRWHGVTVELEHYLEQISKRGFDLDTGFLLRLVLAVMTGQSRFNLFFKGDRQNTSVSDLQDAWKRVKRAMDQAASFIIHNCHIDRPQLLRYKTVLIPLVAFFDRYGMDVTPAQARALQHWVYMAIVWTRYTGPTETLLDQDLSALAKSQPIQIMTQNIEDRVGRRPITERELQGKYTESPYTLMLYVLARRAGAQDWFNGVVLGSGQPLELHHIFPKAYLQKNNYDLRKHGALIDQIANIAFLSQRANSRISTTAPIDYLKDVDESRLKAQYIPLDRSLWRAERFEDFLLERRRLLAEAVNNLLTSLAEDQQASAWPPDSSDTFLEVRVNAVEKQLRELIEERLTADQGDYAWEHAVPSDIRRSVRYRIDQSVERNPFEADKYSSLSAKLALCQFSDYPKIMLANWALFQDLFGDQNRFSQHVSAIIEARNALKHGREINRTDRALAQAGLNWIEDAIRVADESAAEEESLVTAS